MEDVMKLYWEIFFDEQPTDKVIKYSPNPLKEYEDEFIDGAIVDIGCGQSNFLLEYANSGRTLYAVDNEQFQLDFLKRRAESLSTCGLKNWEFLNSNFPQDNLPENSYSVIILSNLLHFFSLDQCRQLEKKLSVNTQKGTLIYVQVHSYRHYANNPKDPGNNDYFKHYFKIKDLTQIFPPDKYQVVYQAEIEKIYSQTEQVIISKWLDRSFEVQGVFDIQTKEELKKEYLEEARQSNIQMIFRRK